MKIFFILTVLIVNVYCIHITLLIDTAIPNFEVEPGFKEALLQGFDKYLLNQDTLSVITFDNKQARFILKRVPVSKRDHILHVLQHELKFSIGCADWANALKLLFNEHLNSQHAYLITDENPCGIEDPVLYARQLAGEGTTVTGIGIGHEFIRSTRWLDAITTNNGKGVFVKDISFLQRKRYQQQQQQDPIKRYKRHPTASDPAAPLTGGEIAALVIVSVVILILLILSLIYACRYNNNINNARKTIKK